MVAATQWGKLGAGSYGQRLADFFYINVAWPIPFVLLPMERLPGGWGDGSQRAQISLADVSPLLTPSPSSSRRWNDSSRRGGGPPDPFGSYRLVFLGAHVQTNDAI